jgi:8-oxo-dGTP diphosphatase
MDGEKPRVLVIHRDRHGDYSFPKGKVDPGETLPETAVREIEEETGYRVTLDAPLGSIEYQLPSGRQKEVHYWAAEVSQAEFERVQFAPNEEVDEQKWMGLKKAAKHLTYARDKELLAVLRERIDAGTARTFAVIALRHAQAVPPLSWPGDDDSRPLTSRGQEQAEQVMPILRAFGPKRLVSSSAVRCLTTVGPISKELDVTPVSERAISQSAAPGDDDIAEVIAEAMADRSTVVLCSHSPVMPDIVRAVARACGNEPTSLSRYSMLSTAEFTLLHVPAEGASRGLVAVESQGPRI